MRRLITIMISTFLLAAVLSAVMFREDLAKAGFNALIGHLVGAPVTTGSVRFSGDNIIDIYDLRIHNPEGFPRDVLMEVSHLVLRYEKVDLLHRRVPIDFVDIELERMNVIRNEQGVLNIDRLKFITCTPEEREAFYRMFPVKIMELSIKRVVYTDKTLAGDDGFVTTFDVMLQDRIYENIPDFTGLMVIIFHEALGETVIKGAAFYGLVAVAGTGFWPLGVGLLVAGNDSATFGFDVLPEDLFLKTFNVVRRIGGQAKRLKRVKDSLIIKADIRGHYVTIRIEDDDTYLSKLTVHARKYMLPRPTFARNILYEISRTSI
jgi:hypothetical protein